MIAFFVPGKARAQPKKIISRNRLVPRDKDGNAAAWADAIQWYGRKAMAGIDLISGPFSMVCCFYMIAGKHREWFDKVPDDDNLAYLVSNALSRVVYYDDRQRVDLRVIKRLAGKVPSGVYIEIKELSIAPEDWFDQSNRALLTIRAEEKK